MPTHCVTGRGFNNLSQVNMARHIPTGQLVAVKQTNLDECTEEELLQLMVIAALHAVMYLRYTRLYMCLYPLDISILNPRMRYCCPVSSVTPTCWLLAWFSAPAASCGSWHHSWPTVSHNHTSTAFYPNVEAFMAFFVIFPVLWFL